MTFMITLSIEWPSVVAKWKALMMCRLFFPWLFTFVVMLLLLVSFNKFSCHGHNSLCNCWYMLYEHKCKLDVLLLTIIFAAILFTDRKPITPFKDQSHNSLEINEDKSFHCMKDVNARQWPSSFFMMWTWFISYIQCGTLFCTYGLVSIGD